MCLRFSFPAANEFIDQFCLKTLKRNPSKHNEIIALRLLSWNTEAVYWWISTLTLLRRTHPGKGTQIKFSLEIKCDFQNTTQPLIALQERLKNPTKQNTMAHSRFLQNCPQAHLLFSLWNTLQGPLWDRILMNHSGFVLKKWGKS